MHKKVEAKKAIPVYFYSSRGQHQKNRDPDKRDSNVKKRKKRFLCR